MADLFSDDNWQEEETLLNKKTSQVGVYGILLQMNS